MIPGEPCCIYIQNEAFASILAVDLRSSKEEIPDVHLSSTDFPLRPISVFAGT